MKKLLIFLLLVSVILMLVFSSSYKKNPHLSKINDDVSIAKMKIKEKSYFDDSEVEELGAKIVELPMACKGSPNSETREKLQGLAKKIATM